MVVGNFNLYMRRKREQLTLTTDHRAAPSQEHLPLALTQNGDARDLVLSAPPPTPAAKSTASHSQRVRNALIGLTEPIPVQRLR